MKKSFVKHLVQFTAAMSLCAAVLIGTPSGGTPVPPPDGNNGKPVIKTEDSLEPSGKGGLGEEPKAEPQDDKDRGTQEWE